MLLELDQLAARVQAELVDQHRAGPLERAEGLRLPARPGAAPWRAGPSAAPGTAPAATSARACSSTPRRGRRGSRPPRAAPRRPSAGPRAARPPPAPAPTPPGRPAPGPRHRSSASCTRYDARSGSPPPGPPAPARRAARTAGGPARRRSTSGGSRTDPDSMAAAPSRLRSRTTQPCTTFAHDAGRSSPHSASASASVLIGSPARTTSAESTTRSLGLEAVRPGRRPGAGRARRYPWLRLSTRCPGRRQRRRYPADTAPAASRYRGRAEQRREAAGRGLLRSPS